MTDFHVHSTFCDGENTPEEMVRAALQAGLSAIGFSGHSYTHYEDYCMVQRAEAYRAEIARLKEAYRGKIDVFCGLEMDLFSEEDPEVYDYVIGSVHSLRVGDAYIPVDYKEEILRRLAREEYGGDVYTLAERYYEQEAEVFEKTRCDIIGHFDLIAKFNEDGRLFDEENPRYKKAWQSAAERLLKSGKPFEINTGAISRGYRSTPYPALPIAKWLAEHGARFVLSGDAHSTEGLCFQFDKWAEVYGKTVPIVPFTPPKK